MPILLPTAAEVSLFTTRVRSAFSRRAYWVAHFRDGRTVHEWQVDWSLLPQKGLYKVLLVCPNTQVGVLETQGDGRGRFLQFKMAYADGWGSKGPVTEAHLIGLVHGTDGEAKFWRWEPEPFRLVGPYDDNVAPGRMTYGGGATNQLAFEHMGTTPD